MKDFDKFNLDKEILKSFWHDYPNQQKPTTAQTSEKEKLCES